MTANLLEEKLSALITSLKEDFNEDQMLIAARPPGPPPEISSPIIYSDELKYLNKHWGNWDEPTKFDSHRPLIGKLFSRIKRKIQAYLFQVLFKDYFERERQFTMSLVQYCNMSAKYIDRRYEQLHWQVIEKIDKEVEQINLRNDSLFAEIVKDRILK